MHIHGTNRIHGPHGINPPHISTRAAGAQRSAGAGSVDRVDISPAAEAAMAAEGSPIRHDLVNLIRRQIAAGTYDTPEKMDIAMSRLLDEIG
ncbi:MAG TPA: flagellar biosynthesis anti-sigma factor FlgM [Lacipirellulaceae bacterium]|nr:flagellar biosynthesis anti-sigma factor FlgM [Lacipirellulaceae bacterium]